MQHFAKITRIRETEQGTDLIVHVPEEKLEREIAKYSNGGTTNAEIRIDDGRTITAEQRKKAYATIRDIADYLGDWPEYYKNFLKFNFCMEKSIEYFSLSNCSVETAREFLNYIMDFVLANDIPLSEKALRRTDDIDRYLWSCLKYGKCCICGQAGEIHHWDAVGMGRDRREIDDSQNKKMCLCRRHHTEAHSMGNDLFEKKYHVYGVKYQKEVEKIDDT